MIAGKDRQRLRRVQILAAVAVLVWGLILVEQWWHEPPDDQHPLMGQPVLPEFSQINSMIDQIQIKLADKTYNLKRVESDWVMPEAGNYPVREDRMRELATGLETLSYAERRTSNPEKYGLLGLESPQTGGNGVQLTLSGGGETLQFLTGRRDDRLYIRQLDQAQTYRVMGTLPPFYSEHAWLDFDILNLESAAIHAVRLSDQTGLALYMNRPNGERGQRFTPAPPYQNARVISRMGALSTALAISRFAPLDAKPADALTTDPIAVHISETFDGLEIEIRAYQEGDGGWVTLTAIEAGEGARRAIAINQKAHGWAYRLSAYDFDDFTPELSSLVSWSDQDISEP